MKDYNATALEQENGQKSDFEKNNLLRNITDSRERSYDPARSFYKRLLAREELDHFKHLSETVRTNAGKIARIFHLSEIEEDLLAEMSLLQFGNGAMAESVSRGFFDVLPSLVPTAPLRKFALVEAKENPGSPFPDFAITERMMDALLGVPSMDPIISKMTEELPAPGLLTESRKAFARKIAGMVRGFIAKREPESDPTGIFIQLTDRDHRELYSAASLISRESGLEPVLLRLRSILYSVNHEAAFIQLWNRDTRMSPMAAVVDLAGIDSPQEIHRIIELIACLRSPVFLLSPVMRESFRHRFMSFSLPELDYKDQDELWHNALAPAAGRLAPYIYELTNDFTLKPSEIARIGALVLADDPEAENAKAVAAELRREVRKATRPPIQDLAALIEPVATLKDLALSQHALNVLHEIVNRIKNTRRVLYEGGFKKKFQRGLATTALFYGESGTGKTHAAEAIAGELDLDLFRIDLSQVISKYIGETEKNLGRIFDGAKNSGTILLFDEADALFGKRSEVNDAHDRYANQEISYLLQKMEEYEGLSILTSNLAGNMDAAFNRRISYRIFFPATDEKTRLSIWKRIFPVEVNTEKVRFEELAEELELSGAEIKNLALRAAYAAAGEPISMKHIRSVLKNELEKSGIFINEGDLVHWYRDE